MRGRSRSGGLACYSRSPSNTESLGVNPIHNLVLTRTLAAETPLRWQGARLVSGTATERFDALLDASFGASAADGRQDGVADGPRPRPTALDEPPTTYVLIHGAGDVGWHWHLVDAELRARGHAVIAMDLPVDDDAAGLSDYADVVVDSVGGGGDVVVVGHSFGAYVAPLVCERVSARLLILVAPMIPAPGESADEMFASTGYAGYASPAAEGHDDMAIFYHDVDPTLAAEALSRGRPQSGAPGREPWPLDAWPRVPTRCLLCRDDRIFPIAWLRPVVRDRLGITPDEIDGGHTPALSRPDELARRLDAYRADVSRVREAARD